jgi:hypothetical protein
MDIDGTLTPPRRVIEQEMVDALGALRVPFGVAAGSHLEMLRSQFFGPLWALGLRRDFDAWLSNGATRYACRFSQGPEVRKVEDFSIRAHLGEADYALLMDVLETVLRAPEFAIPEALRPFPGETTIVDRGSMVNFTPMGRPAGDVGERARTKRDGFAAFDRETGYRARVLAHLGRALGRLVEGKQLSLLLGGQTSFDLVVDGKDKTNAVRALLAEGFDRVVFFGDALSGDGNDSVIRRYVEGWRGAEPCPLTAIEVDGWRDTIAQFRRHGWLPE